MLDNEPKRRRTKKPKLCTHGYPAIPNPRGCAACWTKHPGYVKPKPKERAVPVFAQQVTCEKCFLPSQTGMPPLRRMAAPKGEPAKYAHTVCPSDTMAGATSPRRIRRFLRRTLVGSLRRHMRKMARIQHARRERASVLRIETARLERLLAIKERQEKEEKARARKRPSRAAG